MLELSWYLNGKVRVQVMGSDQCGSKRPFPLNVVPAPGGWCVTVIAENGENRHLLKPGWQEDTTRPYIFESSQEAWNFIKQLFQFCFQQARMQYHQTDKVQNCQQCGRVFRAKFFNYCHECLQANEFLLQQIWQGFYYMTGTDEGAFHKIALLLKMSQDEFTNIPEAFQSMVQHHLTINVEMEKSRKLTQIQKSIVEGRGMHRSVSRKRI